jgi:hypothetical protein
MLTHNPIHNIHISFRSSQISGYLRDIEDIPMIRVDLNRIFTPQDFLEYQTQIRRQGFQSAEIMYSRICVVLAEVCARALVKEDLLKSLDERRRRTLEIDEEELMKEARNSAVTAAYRSTRGNYTHDTPSINSTKVKMPWSVAARQRTLCSRFLQLFDLVEFMVRGSLRALFLNHMTLLTEIVLPGTRRETQSELSNDHDFTVFEAITEQMEVSWKDQFMTKFASSSPESTTILAGIDDAAILASEIISSLYTRIIPAPELFSSNINPTPPKDELLSAIRMFSKADTIGTEEFVHAVRKHIAERARIKCFFNFEVNVDFEEMR